MPGRGSEGRDGCLWLRSCLGMRRSCSTARRPGTPTLSETPKTKVKVAQPTLSETPDKKVKLALGWGNRQQVQFQQQQRERETKRGWKIAITRTRRRERHSKYHARSLKENTAQNTQVHFSDVKIPCWRLRTATHPERMVLTCQHRKSCDHSTGQNTFGSGRLAWSAMKMPPFC